MNECVFCKIIKGEITCVKIWEDKKFLAFLDINPVCEGMTLVVPKKHLKSDVFENTDKDISDIMKASKKVSKLLKKSLNVVRVGVILEGLEIPHLHVKLIPIRPGENLKILLNSKNKSPDLKYLQKLALRIGKNNRA